MSKKNYFNQQGKQQSGATQESEPVAAATQTSTEVATTETSVETPVAAVAETPVITTAVETVSTPVVVETPSAPVQEIVKPVAQAPVAKQAAHAKQSKEGFTPVYKVELELNGYAEAMDRTKSIIPEEGGKWQYSLFTTIKSVFAAKSQEEFNSEFNTILQFFNKNKEGIFNEKFIFRFPEYWSGSQNEFSFFRRVVYLIIQTADVKGRKKALEQINLGMVAEGLTEPQRNMLFNYYLQ